jgi:very-short-patch-repair endonuclease
VQGDERDIIIISVGYGKDAEGVFSTNMGPLSKEESGYKRLNVAITRARIKTIILSSVEPEMMDEDKIKNGVKYLKHYLHYAKHKDFLKTYTTSETIEFESDFEESVYFTLKNRGHNVTTQVGCSGYRIDLAVKHPKKPGEFILGIECDGAQYHSSQYARDRDKVRQMILENLGWKIHRIWSDDWLNNKEFELGRIENKLEEIIKEKKKIENYKDSPINEERTTSNKLPKIEEEIVFKEIPLESKYPRYKMTELPMKHLDIRFNTLGDTVNDMHRVNILGRMISVIKTESPIEQDLLFKRVTLSIGIQKLGSRIETFLKKLLKEIISENDFYQDKKTIAKNKNSIYKVRISTEEERPFILIPKEELGGAILDIIKNTFSIEEDALIKDVATGIYGNNRIGTKIHNKVKEALRYLQHKNLIICKDDKYYLSEKS